MIEDFLTRPMPLPLLVPECLTCRQLNGRRPMIGLRRIELQKLTPAHLQAFYSRKLESGRVDGKGDLSPRTVQYLHRVIREALQQAMKWNLVVRNVADATEPPKAQRKPPQVWDSEYVNRFLAYVEDQDDRLNPLWHLALSTGMRRGELLGLRWQDIDLEQAVLRIHQNLVEVDGKILFQEPKTRSGRRTVALFPTTVERLRAHRARQNSRRSKLGEVWEDYDLVFTNDVGGPLYPANVNNHFGKILNAAGFPKITFHGLRHTHATLMLKDGMHLKITSERLGHSTIALTADTYSHVLPDMQRQVLSQIDASVFEPQQKQA